ncbi:chromophore lyase CpcT/CpeT [Psychroserpens sp.]|uniref:chromophore lyase CpcT/CpeT n=1 Tax=Psychroserpens sp. TaxID=2020870 RepID=UPI001B2EC6F6|nr:chromophore lyase CpcT/CpeT [Psychroserpens sp.]MBO6606269.1 chromophore lyase CpcT/CpeT [Psychroserpens sp.]MBO6632532.1 chromophore lyase CpcT/CpeT [Psychroserpens sp.]MBO6655123.1 chromophore lyase CpcT/CpeT [Psychroserpens sp.]MBO6683287.1 chromophore lyase CpcT/CpeT [Psychroserpens sp.]MBO6751386.1 chromophore lyase CpcT/CpeT [Psychroserpens sp.]
MYRYHLLIFALIICLYPNVSESSKDANINRINTDLDELHKLMQGSFNSEIQAKNDSTYYNISLHMYSIWQDKGHFLYVEQALNSRQHNPYRQRIYELTQLDDTTFSSAIYTITNDSLWIGKWQTPKDFDKLTMSDVSKKEGCEVILKRLDKNHYKGQTGERSCESTLYGASYATSEVEIWNNRIVSWDRGFDADGNHIWGAEKGGYIFNKLD